MQASRGCLQAKVSQQAPSIRLNSGIVSRKKYVVVFTFQKSIKQSLDDDKLMVHI